MNALWLVLAASSVQAAPTVPAACTGSSLALTDALTSRCASHDGALRRPLAPGVHVILEATPTTVKPGGEVALVLRITNDTDLPQALWLDRLPMSALLSFSATDARDRDVSLPPQPPGGAGMGIGPSIDLAAHPDGLLIVLPPHGVATAAHRWMAKGFSQDAIATPPPAAPKPKVKAKPRAHHRPLTSKERMAALASMGPLFPEGGPLQPGVYRVSANIRLLGAPRATVEVTVAP